MGSWGDLLGWLSNAIGIPHGTQMCQPGQGGSGGGREPPAPRQSPPLQALLATLLDVRWPP